jgi:RNA polymerase sigma-70 factor (ECF subfamily)
VVDALPPERKKIFQMSRFEGLKYKEIADQLGLSVKTVEAQMGKALKTLRENLADYLVMLILVIVEILLFFLGNE